MAACFITVAQMHTNPAILLAFQLFCSLSYKKGVNGWSKWVVKSLLWCNTLRTCQLRVHMKSIRPQWGDVHWQKSQVTLLAVLSMSWPVMCERLGSPGFFSEIADRDTLSCLQMLPCSPLKHHHYNSVHAQTTCWWTAQYGCYRTSTLDSIFVYFLAFCCRVLTPLRVIQLIPTLCTLVWYCTLSLSNFLFPSLSPPLHLSLSLSGLSER